MGNTAGYDVLDFRDSESRKFFSRTSNIINIGKFKNVKSYIEKTQMILKRLKNC